MRSFLLVCLLTAACAADPDAADGTAVVDAGGAPDAAATAPEATPETAGHQPLLKAGLHPDASDALRGLGITADRISQTIGNAPASAGTHGVDGVANGQPFSAATDLRTGGMSQAAIRQELDDLGRAGFAAWYRRTGHDGWRGVTHIHAVWVNTAIKRSLRAQAHDYCNWKNGLVSHAPYLFFHFSQAAVDLVRARFLAHNPVAD